MDRMSSHITRAVALLILLNGHALHAAPPPNNDVALEETVSQAQTRFRRALELYQEGNLDAARAEFHRAYDESPNYRVLYNLAQVQFELHDYPAALATFEKYLHDGGNRIAAERRAQVTADVEKLQSRVALVDIRANVAEAEVFVDDVPVGSLPLSAPVVVSAGRRKIALTRVGYVPATQWLDVGGGDRPRLSFELREVVLSARPERKGIDLTERLAPARPPPRAGDGVPWFGWFATGTLALGAGVAGALALTAAADLQRDRTSFGVERAEMDQQKRNVDQLALATDVLIGAAAVSAGVSLYLTLTRKPKLESSSPELSLGYRSLALSGKF
jgi:hypothetical protein